MLRLRLHHHHDGARIAYREAGTGPALVLAHAPLLSHKEFEPLVEWLADRYRLILPDLPLHGDSEDRPRHPYTLEWAAEVLADFCTAVAGPRPLVGGHDVGATLLLHATLAGRLHPARLVLLPNPLHRPTRRARATAWRAAARTGAVPGLDRVLSHTAPRAFRPSRGPALTARDVPEARDLVRHAFADLPGNVNRTRAWAKAAGAWPRGGPDLLDRYRELDVPTLLLWADGDERHPVEVAEEARGLLPDAQLRVLPQTGYLLTYDDPVGVARELGAFLA